MADIPTEPPSRGLKGKSAIVTGAGCAGDGIGNGRAIAIMLADEGCNVVCLDMSLTDVEKTASMIASKTGRGKALALQCDVTKAKDVETCVQQALDSFGRLDILVNNVGIGGAAGTALDVDMEAFAKGLEINVSSMVLMAKFCIPAMLKNEGPTKGNVVNMGSVAGLKGGTPHLLYPTSKGAVVNMTRAMAAHHAEDGIRVNCVCPGVSNISLYMRNQIFRPLHGYVLISVDALHAYDVRKRYERRGSRGAAKEKSSWDGRNCMGCSVCGYLPC